MRCFWVITLLLLGSGQIHAGDDKKPVQHLHIKLEQKLAAAVDRRDAKDPTLETAIAAIGADESIDRMAILGLGQIGDAEACRALIALLSHKEDYIRLASAQAVGLCGNIQLAAHLRYRLGQEKDKAIRGELAYSLGHLGLESDRERLIILVNNDGDGRTIQGLMQSIVYSRLAVKDMPDLDYAKLLKRLPLEPDVALSGAYLIARVGGLHTVVSFGEFSAAFQAIENEQARIFLSASLAGYGAEAVPLLAQLATGKSVELRIEAAKALGKIEGEKTADLLTNLIVDSASWVRFSALTAVANHGHWADIALNASIKSALQDPSPMVKVAALRTMAKFDPESATLIARNWAKADGLHTQAAAMRLLGGDAESRAMLEGYAEDNEQLYLRAAARAALKVEAEENTGNARTVPGADEVEASQGQLLKLQTTRGGILIRFLPHAPFATENFVTLADYGFMDDMIWHRVIPNFVAQAGDRNDSFGENWGTIREEWAENSFDDKANGHRVGTLGVATSGRDTGSNQFFINTRHNLHLNGRYTVFAEVIEGMDVVFMLEEGDMIISAKTVAK